MEFPNIHLLQVNNFKTSSSLLSFNKIKAYLKGFLN